MQIQRNRRLRLGFFVIAGLIFLVALIFPEWARLAIKKDREEAVPRVGVATVAILVPAAPAPIGDNPSPPIVSVRFRGSIVPVKTVAGFSQLHLGQTVQIIYRIGRSGRIYVDRIEPLPASNLKIGVRRWEKSNAHSTAGPGDWRKLKASSYISNA